MARLRLSVLARADIVHVLSWTEQRYGERARYEQLLSFALRDLAADPLRLGAMARPELGEGIRCYHLRGVRKQAGVARPRHLILYRVGGAGVVEVGRILHDAMEFAVTYKGRSRTVDLPGYYAKDSNEGIHVGGDMAVTDVAVRFLKEEVDGIPSPATIRRVRHKLKLSQREAGGLLKVGEAAFDKYERGLAEPSGPTSQLLRLLDRHPELVEELRLNAG